MDEIRFYRVADEYGCLSNFSPHPIFVGTTFPTSEHYFQSQKFLRQPEVHHAILANQSPMVAARIGRSRQWTLRPDWESVKDDVMLRALRAKALQHADVRSTLLSTGTARIVEHSANDSYWADGGDGSGLNMLGVLWMRVRDEYTADGPFDELRNPLLPPWLQHPELDRYSIGWRMGYGEDYMCTWGPWYSGLTAGGQQRYKELYAPPAGEWADYWENTD